MCDYHAVAADERRRGSDIDARPRVLNEQHPSKLLVLKTVLKTTIIKTIIIGVGRAAAAQD